MQEIPPDAPPEIKRRRDNRILGSLWIDARIPSIPLWLYVAPAIVLGSAAVGLFGLMFLGWDASPGR